MGLPVWREPAEKHGTENILDPRRAAITRRSRNLTDSTRPRIRASDRSSETLFNLLRSDYALESMNVGHTAPFSAERRGTFSNWNEVNALSSTGPDSERAALRVSLSDLEPRWVRGGLRRMRSPVPIVRSEVSRGSSTSGSSEVYTPRFPPAFPEREMARERFREMEGETERESIRQAERERERERERQDSDERRRFQPPFATVAEGITARRGGDESGGPRFRFPARIPRYLADVVDEGGNGRQNGPYMTRSLHLPRFDIDGLGDRERSLSPDATQWELVASDLGFAACDLWESEESDGEGGEGDQGNQYGIPDHLWDTTQERDEGFRVRRLTSLFSSRNREVDLLTEHL